MTNLHIVVFLKILIHYCIRYTCIDKFAYAFKMFICLFHYNRIILLHDKIVYFTEECYGCNVCYIIEFTI